MSSMQLIFKQLWWLSLTKCIASTKTSLGRLCNVHSSVVVECGGKHIECILFMHNVGKNGSWLNGLMWVPGRQLNTSGMSDMDLKL